MTEQEIVLDIRKRLVLSMNGIASADMKESGMKYRLNYGVELPRIKEIASDFSKDSKVAAALWKEDIRECRMLAAMLYPEEMFLPDLACVWVSQIKYPDLAEVCSMYLFSRMKDASQLAFQWIASENEMVQYCGFLTILHLLRRGGGEMNERYRAELVDQARAAVGNGGFFPGQVARRVLDFLESDGKR